MAETIKPEYLYTLREASDGEFVAELHQGLNVGPCKIIGSPPGPWYLQAPYPWPGQQPSQFRIVSGLPWIKEVGT